MAIPPMTGIGLVCKERAFGLSRRHNLFSGRLKYRVNNTDIKKATIIKVRIMLFTDVFFK
jgi:hypothetical protein